MDILSSFKQIDLTRANPYMSLGSYGITFNKDVLVIMEFPDYVELFLDESSQRLAIKVSGKTDASIPFCILQNNKVNVRINNKDFATKLYSLARLDSFYTYRFSGEWHESEKVFVFDLNKTLSSSASIFDDV